MGWSNTIANKAMDIVESHENEHGRISIRVHQKGVGYDLHSQNSNEERFIEVKGISESWKTYTWQPLHRTEFEALQSSPDKFYLYIVHFDIAKENRNENYLNSALRRIYIIPGRNLQTDFRIIPQTFALSPISQRKLEAYEVVENQVVQSPGKDV
jgi:hypothetical protein